MGLTKTEHYTPAQNSLALLAKALGHPARIAILQQLMKTDACICGDLVLEIGLAQPTISQHLKALKEAGLIKGNISGTSICYCIDPTAWEAARSVFSDLFAQGAAPANCC